jgi:Ca-activated chloride channel family protein
MPTRASSLVLAASLLLAAAPCAAQYEGELEVDAVVAPVTVRTSSGRIVGDVGFRRFHLFVDGVETPIQDLAREQDLPLSLGFVLDTSGSMAGRKMEACQQLITAFLNQRRGSDEVAMWTFGDDRVLERFPFGMGWYLLPRILESIRPWSTTALYDMVQRFPEVMERARHPRRAVILLTDGVDNASEISHRDALDIAQGLVTPVYVLGVEPPPRPAGEEGPAYEEVLMLIAESSGGDYRRIPRSENMPKVVEELLHELSSRFLITFETSGIGIRKWRTLEVKVDGYEANTRQGYVGTLP